MTKFTDQLFDDLMREHGPALARTRPPAARRRPLAGRRTVLLAAGAGGLAVAATAGTLAAGGGTPAHGDGASAYAVTKNPDGTVTLAVYRASGIAGANARLRQLDDGRVVIVPAKPGCPSLGSLPAPAVPAHLVVMERSSRKGGSITVNAQGIPAGDILVVAAESFADGSVSGSRLTSPPAPGCVSLSPPPGNG